MKDGHARRGMPSVPTPLLLPPQPPWWKQLPPRVSVLKTAVNNCIITGLHTQTDLEILSQAKVPAELHSKALTSAPGGGD